MSEEIKPQRPEPVLQPMKIVQVDESTIPKQPEGDVPRDAKGKKLVMSKKEIEAKKLQASAPKPSLLHRSEAIVQANQQVISDLDRNAKSARNDNQAPEFDEEWLAKIGGRIVHVAWLQTSVSISGYVSSETTFSPQKIMGLTMSWSNDGLLCKIDNNRNPSIEILIPAANVKCMVV